MKSRTLIASCHGPGVNVRHAWLLGTSSIPGVLGLNFDETGVVVIFALPVGLLHPFPLVIRGYGSWKNRPWDASPVPSLAACDVTHICARKRGIRRDPGHNGVRNRGTFQSLRGHDFGAGGVG